MLSQKVADRLCVIYGDTDELQAALAQTLLHTAEFRHFLAAGATPTGPEIQHDDLASPLGETVRLPIEIG